MQPSLRTALLAAMLMVGATAQFTFSNDAGGDKNDIGEVQSLEAGDEGSSVSEVVVLAALDCATLASAADAASLEIALSPTETITANKVSFETADGSLFAGGNARLSWHGIVPNPAEGGELQPREVGMTWSDPCEPEGFVLTVTSFELDGSTSTKQSIPCTAGADVDICLVEVTRATFLEDSGDITDDSTSSIVESGVRRRLRPILSRNVHLPRNLQATGTTIDVMYLYTEAAQVLMGDISDQQMESIIFGGLASTNAAFVNSEIDLSFNLAYIGSSPTDEDSDSAVGTVRAIREDDDIADLRDTHQADLVQLVGAFDSSCSAAASFNGNALNGFSVVNPVCIENFSQSHAFGQNLGCSVNRENSAVERTFQHGYRVCEGDNPFRTIMSFTCPSVEAPRINHFSNPSVDFMDEPTGTDTENCAEAIRDNMGGVESFQAAPTVDPTGFVPLGCFNDVINDRALTLAAIKGEPDMTTEVCADFCAGFSAVFFGTQFGTECFCGGSADDPETHGSSTSCNMPCSGDASQICGGNKAINIFEYQDQEQDGFVGCFLDSFDRVLSGEEFSDPDMTTDCFCGLETDNPVTTADNCDFECAGDSSEICGGSFAISVYQQTTSAPELGCYADVRGDRIFTKALVSDDLTTELCAETCSDFVYYGTQFANECWCGDDDDDFTLHGESDGCTMACAGASGEICGGSFAMNVYES